MQTSHVNQTLLLFVLLLTHCRAITTTPHPSNSAKCTALKTYAKTNSIVLVNASILPKAIANTAVIHNGVVHVCHGQIVFVGNHTSYTSQKHDFCQAPILKLSSKDVVVPAFLNLHTHAAMSLFKNLGNDISLDEWLQNFFFPLERNLVDEKFCRIGATLAMAEYLASGTSTFADMYFFQDAVAEEVSKVGMRSFLGQSIIDFPQPDAGTPNETLLLGEKYIKKWKGHHLVEPLLTPHAPYTTSKDIYQKAVAINRKYGVRTWSHCSETQDENKDFRAHQGIPKNSTLTATEWLNQIGVMGPDLTCAHSVWLTDDDIKLYAKTGTSAAHCPSSNMKLASGFMRYSAMKKEGVKIAFGTDGHASNNDVDLVEEAKLAAQIHKGIDLNPKTLPAIDALYHMTLGAAEAVGRGDVQGSIEIGKKGDFAVFRGESVKWTPRFDILENGSLKADDTAALITYNSNGYDVRGTVVDGNLLYFDGCYTTIPIYTLLQEVKGIGMKIRDFLAR